MDASRYAPAFFDLQWRFVTRIAALSDTRAVDQITAFTVLPAALGYRTDDPAYLDDLAQTHAPVEFLYETYVALPAPARDPGETRFGCFRYVSPWRSTRKLRLHFANLDPTGHPLAAERMAHRIAELHALIADVERRGLDVTTVRGGSWLYHVPAYRRLFPPVYLDTLTPSPPEPSFLSQWGQFLRADGSVRSSLADDFLAALAEATTTVECLAAFPLPVLKAECDFRDFRDALSS